MFFTVLSTVGWASGGRQPGAFLIKDSWDDWFKYNTLYTLYIVDARGERHSIGGVKIGQFAMEAGQRRAAVPDSFDELDERFFSLGQDDSYYENLNELGSGLRDVVLRGLRDIALDQQLFKRARSESVTGMSLLRWVHQQPCKANSVDWRAARRASPGMNSATRDPSRHDRGRNRLHSPLC